MVITGCHLTFSLASRKGLVVIMLCILSDQYIVEHFTAAGSVVNLRALDMSKAFDKVNHYALWIKLMDRSVPLTFLRTLMHWYWYSLCSAVVRWENVFCPVPLTVWCETRRCAVASIICSVCEQLNRVQLYTVYITGYLGLDATTKFAKLTFCTIIP